MLKLARIIVCFHDNQQVKSLCLNVKIANTKESLISRSTIAPKEIGKVLINHKKRNEKENPYKLLYAYATIVLPVISITSFFTR